MTKTVKDNLKEHLWPYRDEDIQKIREEKTQLVTAAEFAEAHMEKLEAERKLAAAVEALKRISEIPDQEEYFDCEECISMMEEAAKAALAEIGGKDEQHN